MDSKKFFIETFEKTFGIRGVSEGDFEKIIQIRNMCLETMDEYERIDLLTEAVRGNRIREATCLAKTLRITEYSTQLNSVLTIAIKMQLTNMIAHLIDEGRIIPDEYSFMELVKKNMVDFVGDFVFTMTKIAAEEIPWEELLEISPSDEMTDALTNEMGKFDE